MRVLLPIMYLIYLILRDYPKIIIDYKVCYYCVRPPWKFRYEGRNPRFLSYVNYGQPLIFLGTRSLNPKGSLNTWECKNSFKTSINSNFKIFQGLYLECARWNRTTQLLDESYPKILFDSLPIITMTPTVTANDSDYKETQKYDCPIYKTTERRGVLATTGHSSNFIMFIDLNTDKSPYHWINRGTACICSVNDWTQNFKVWFFSKICTIFYIFVLIAIDPYILYCNDFFYKIL